MKFVLSVAAVSMVLLIIIDKGQFARASTYSIIFREIFLFFGGLFLYIPLKQVFFAIFLIILQCQWNNNIVIAAYDGQKLLKKYNF